MTAIVTTITAEFIVIDFVREQVTDSTAMITDSEADFVVTNSTRWEAVDSS